MSSPSSAGFDLHAFVGQLKDLLESLPGDVRTEGISKSRLKRLRSDLGHAIERLNALAVTLDPIRQPATVLDPSQPGVIGELIARTLLMQQFWPLGEVQPFYGSGVYALYYTGDHPAYHRVRGKDWPLYVGKADPAAPQAQSAREQGDRLARRLGDHSRSVVATENLELDDFRCRYLVVRSAWQNTAEQYLIDWFQPVWNNEMKVCFGFGKHGDAPETRGNTRSPWDTLHPGRKWALKPNNRPNPKKATDIERDVDAHLRSTYRKTRRTQPR